MTSEDLLEQLEDRNDEDYSEYLEVLEETAADPILPDDAQVVEILDCVNEEELNHEILDKDYAREIENNYIRIRPKKMKLIHEEADSPKIDQNINTIVISTADLQSHTEDLETQDHNDPIDDSHHDLSLNNSNSKECYAEEVPKSSIELFFDSMAQTVRLLPPKAQAEVKMSVCRIVTEAEVKYASETKCRNIQKFIAPPGMIPKLVLIPCSMIDNPRNNN